MPVSNEDTSRKMNSVNKKLETLSKTMNDLYSSTYMSANTDKDTMDSIVGDIDDGIDELLTTINNRNVSDISTLYLRAMNNGENQKSDLTKGIESLFDDNGNILDSINFDIIRKSIQAEDYQYDLICRYMTKLEDALDIKKDCVLSSDNFTKEFINIISGLSNKDYIMQFTDRANTIKEKYKIEDLFEDMYYKTSKYGETFLYLVPYKKAFERLMKRKQNIAGQAAKMFGYKIESSSTSIKSESVTIFESTNFNGVVNETKLSKEFTNILEKEKVSVNLYFDESGIIAAPIESVREAYNVSVRYESVTESYITEMEGDPNVSSYVSEENLRLDDDLARDGLVGNNGKTSNKKTKITKEMNGAVAYLIPRDQIFPVVIDKSVVGYIYMQVYNDALTPLDVLGGSYSYNTLTNNTKMMSEEFDKENDLFVSYIAGLIAEKIDEKFINSNLDIKEQIYSILRYNDNFSSTRGTNNVAISFIPADDIQHFYFKLDDKTHRGISDLNKAVVPAMIYCLLYLNTTIGQISRSQDKRLYYVKQNVEQNVSRTLLNVISQLKKGNMGMRQLENMNTIFNVIGRYNDHVIPMGQSGDPPIQIDVMQGQQIETPNDLMERMQDDAINSTDVPLEFIQTANQVDYATRFTMSSSKFLRKVYKRQRICQEKFTIIFRRIYNYEFKENDQTLKINLPVPAFLAMTNTQQLVENIKNYAKSIAEIVIPPDDEELNREFLNIFIRSHLGSYVDFDQIDQVLTEAKHNLEVKKQQEIDAGIEGGEDEEEY